MKAASGIVAIPILIVGAVIFFIFVPATVVIIYAMAFGERLILWAKAKLKSCKTSEQFE